MNAVNNKLGVGTVGGIRFAEHSVGEIQSGVKADAPTGFTSTIMFIKIHFGEIKNFSGYGVVKPRFSDGQQVERLGITLCLELIEMSSKAINIDVANT